MCPMMGQIHPHLLSPSFLLLSCLYPASPSHSMSVLVPSPRAPWVLTPAVSPAPPGAEAPAPTSSGRHHHRCSLERVPGNGPCALRPPLSCCPCRCVRAVCLSAHPVGLEPLSSPLGPSKDWGMWGTRNGGGGGHEGQGLGDVKDVEDGTPLSFMWLVVMSSVLTAGAVPTGTQDLQEIFPFQRQLPRGQLHLLAAGEWGWRRGDHGAFPASCPGAGHPCPLLTPCLIVTPPGAEVPAGAGEEPPATGGDRPDLAPGTVQVLG